MEKNWKNKYIDLIHSKPDYIICSKNSVLDMQATCILQEKLDKFKNVYCEIGSGSGEHLLIQAAKNPDNLYIGLELRFKRIFRTAEKAELIRLRNVLILRHNAKNITDIFKSNSLKGVFVNFPDPWTGKRRWEKHRLLTQNFLNLIEKLLGPDGFISYKTDHQERFLQICDILKADKKFFLKRVTHDLVSSQFYSENIPTEFERLFCKKNLPIYYLHAEKVCS